MLFRHLAVAGALALACPTVVFAQPAPHHSVGQVVRISGAVSVTGGGDVLITQNRSNVFRVTEATWSRHLRGASGESVSARLRVTRPRAFGGDVEVLELERDVAGEVQLPAGGGPMITVNRSNVFQVENEPFRGLLLDAVGRRVEARVRIVEPGLFGGKARVQRLTATAASTSRLLVRARPATAAPVVATLAFGRPLTITGGTARWARVELPDGRRGYATPSALQVGAAASAQDALVRLDRLDYTRTLEWGGDHVQARLVLVRQPDGTYRADVAGEGLASRTGVAVDAQALQPLLEALTAFQQFPDDSFGGDGNHFFTRIEVEAARADGAAVRLSRRFYDPGSAALLELSGDVDAAVERLVRALTAGPVTGLVGTFR